MSKVMPFQRTSALINDIDEFFDRCQEAAMLLEKTFLRFFEHGPDDSLQERFNQIRDVERRADELRRAVANLLYSEMLLPDARGDILELLDEVDNVLDECVHMVGKLHIERPASRESWDDDILELILEVGKGMNAMLAAARIYFKDPLAVRGEIKKIDFHDSEATSLMMKIAAEVYGSDLPLERKRHLGEWLGTIRRLGSMADDVGDKLAIFAIKRSI